MNEYLKTYRIKIKALSPIHIGSGEKISKKEYIYLPQNHHVLIPDVEKMYGDLQKKGLGKSYMEYLLSGGNRVPALGPWLRQSQVRVSEYGKWKKYEMDAGEAFLAQKSRPKDIDAFIKDAYGLPYVPGSSIKGMIRTALIAWELKKNPEKYESIRKKIAMKSRERASRKSCLAAETDELEQMIFYTLNRDPKKRSNAVNDNLSGLHVGDSYPIPVEQLTLSQKIDYTLNGQENALPLLRESLKPGTEIEADITIDSTICPYTMEEIMKALHLFEKICYVFFYSRFQRGTDKPGIVWLGGGCGFLSKTVTYALFGNQAVKVVDGIYKNTLAGRTYNDHKHAKDIGLKIAPHVCKCTKYQGKLYDMGMGYITYKKI